MDFFVQSSRRGQNSFSRLTLARRGVWTVDCGRGSLWDYGCGLMPLEISGACLSLVAADKHDLPLSACQACHHHHHHTTPPCSHLLSPSCHAHISPVTAALVSHKSLRTCRMLPLDNFPWCCNETLSNACCFLQRAVFFSTSRPTRTTNPRIT